MKECPSCRAKLTGTPSKCPACGTALPIEHKYICTNCDKEFAGNRNSCPYCGSKEIYKKSEYLQS